MTLKSIRISTSSSEFVTLPVTEPKPNDRYIFKGAEGLGPNVVDVSIAQTLSGAGLYQGRRPQRRQIVIRIGLNPRHKIGETVEDLRYNLYSFLSPPTGVPVRIELSSTAGGSWIGSLGIDAYISNFEIVPFSKDPEVQITFECIDPYFTTQKRFTRPTHNNGAHEFEYPGTAPAGFYMEIFFMQDFAAGWEIQSVKSQEKIKFLNGFNSADTLVINTIPGQRDVKRIRGNTVTNLLPALNKVSTWIQLHQGINRLQYAASGADPGFTWEHFDYQPAYWGI